MTKQERVELTGEHPVDMFGPDWQNFIEDFNQQNSQYDLDDKDIPTLNDTLTDERTPEQELDDDNKLDEERLRDEQKARIF